MLQSRGQVRDAVVQGGQVRDAIVQGAGKGCCSPGGR